MAEPSPNAYRSGMPMMHNAKTNLSRLRLDSPCCINIKQIREMAVASHSPRVKLQSRLIERIPILSAIHFLLRLLANSADKATNAMGAFMLMVRGQSFDMRGRYSAFMKASLV